MIDHVILFGGAPLLLATVQELKKAKVKTHVYTSPRHGDEPMDASGVTLRDSLKKLGVPFVETEDINAEASLKTLITKTTLGLGLGEAWSFSEDIIEAFDGRLLDFMGIPHPRYRGGAHYTWMILRGERDGACNLQVINKDMVQGVFDSGEIVKTKRYKFPATARTPQDYFDAAVPQEVAFIKEYLAEVRQGKKFVLKRPDESRSLYLPRLHTLKNGWINWGWSGVDIERFICAFDDPYKGASTRLGGVRMHLKGVVLDTAEPPFHPFQSGLITRIYNGIVSVATTSGHLQVKNVFDENGQWINDRLAIGQRFFTPEADLVAALTTVVEYGTKK